MEFAPPFWICNLSHQIVPMHLPLLCSFDHSGGFLSNLLGITNVRLYIGVALGHTGHSHSSYATSVLKLMLVLVQNQLLCKICTGCNSIGISPILLKVDVLSWDSVCSGFV